MITLPICSLCGKKYPESGAPYLCTCGGVYDFPALAPYRTEFIEPHQKSMWKFRSVFGLTDDAPTVSLGEGNTSLVVTEFGENPVWLKLEYQNPTASYKDRGSSVLASFLASRGVKEVVEDSSGNAGASMAAYCARAGIHARIFVPESASGPKRRQIEVFGAELVSIPGPRANAAGAVTAAVTNEVVYASHAFMPFGLAGIASIAYELVNDLGGKTPGTIVAPLGHGGLLYGVMKGFKALRTAAVVTREPLYVGVQSAGCAPVFAAYQNREFTLREAPESDTIAEGVRVKSPVRGEGILHVINGGRGRIMCVQDPELIAAHTELAAKGFFVEPTSALPWAVLKELIGQVPEPIVVILTGAGYKTKS
jgi:threonine synthase